MRARPIPQELTQVRQRASKPSRAKRRPTLLCDPESIVHPDPELLKKMAGDWTQDWNEL
jgi:hypothetical protein